MLFYSDVTYFAWLGTIKLIMTMIFFNKKNIEKYNYVMLGITISLIYLLDSSLLYILFLIGIMVLFTLYSKKLNPYKDYVDPRAWIILGTGLISVYVLLFTLVVYFIYDLIFYIYKRYYKQIPVRIYHIGISLLFIGICYIGWLY